jgi:TM2 domain-containing membrane protein YozV
MGHASDRRGICIEYICIIIVLKILSIVMPLQLLVVRTKNNGIYSEVYDLCIADDRQPFDMKL